MFILSNPTGFWALLGIPAVLAIHFLQKQSRQLKISTLFLLDELDRENLSGHRVERLKSSVPLWLQLLMVLGLTWLLVGPQWLEVAPVQRIVVVMDGSASMVASKKRIVEELPAELKKLQALATTTEFLVLDSRMREEQLFRGTDSTALSEALAAWQPGGGSHDAGPAIRLGRSLANRDGLLVFVTDTPEGALPLEAKRLSFGKPLPNAGFVGFSTEEKDGQLLWRAVLKNHSTEAITREWWTNHEGAKSAPQRANLAPQQAVSLQGLFPPSGQSITLHSTPDDFPLDDSLPAYREQPKALNLKLPNLAENEAAFYQKLFTSLPNTKPVTAGDATHVAVHIYDPTSPTLPTQASILISKDTSEKLSLLTAEILTEAHPMVDGLNFQGLQASAAPSIPFRDNEDEVLVWQGDRPLIFLRGAGRQAQLAFNFDLYRSNARKLPAIVVLIHRYLEAMREATPMPQIANVDCGQALRIAAEPDQEITLTVADQQSKLPVEALSSFRSPEQPGVFTITQGPTALLQAAARFADVREADFTKNGPANELKNVEAATIKKQSQEDRHWRLWLLGLLGLAIGSWGYLGRKTD